MSNCKGFANHIIYSALHHQKFQRNWRNLWGTRPNTFVGCLVGCLRALRRYCITHWHDSVIAFTKQAQEYFQKPLPVNTIRCAIGRCQLKLYHAKRKSFVNMVQKTRRVLWAKAHLKWTVSKWKSVLWSDKSKFNNLVGHHGRCVLRAKDRETFQRVISVQFKSQHIWWYGGA